MIDKPAQKWTGLFFIILYIFSGIGDFSDSRNRKYDFCVLQNI
nr:MAG TPA: hypothetical protein [Caudoviricetes sp.]